MSTLDKSGSGSYFSVMESYDTLTEAINALRKEGYVADLNLKQNGIEFQKRIHEPSEFKIDKIFRFEDNTDPSDQAVLYAISSDRVSRERNFSQRLRLVQRSGRR